MSAKRIRRKRSDWQPERSPSQKSKKPNSLTAHQNGLIEVAKVAPGAMMDNVMRSRSNSKGVSLEPNPEAASPPQALVQPKLTIGEPNDKYEQEADRTAKEVVQTIRAPQPQTFDNVRGDQPSLQCKEEAFQQIWRPTLQARGDKGGTTSEQFDRTLNSARSGGESLDGGLQRSMGEAMGADFSRVKVHTDATANNLSESIQAKAFTTGRDVFFKRGAYQPGSQGGQELIAHELTHVVQQSGGEIQRKGKDVIQREVYKSDSDRTTITWRQFKEALQQQDFSSEVIEKMHPIFVSCKQGNSKDMTEAELIDKALQIKREDEGGSGDRGQDSDATVVDETEQNIGQPDENSQNDQPGVTKSANQLVENYMPNRPDMVRAHEITLGREFRTALILAIGISLKKLGIERQEERAIKKSFTEQWKKEVEYNYGMVYRKEFLAESAKNETERKPDREIFEPLRLDILKIWEDFKTKVKSLNTNKIDWYSKFYQRFLDMVSTPAQFMASFSEGNQEWFEDLQHFYEYEIEDLFEPLGDESANIPDEMNKALAALEQGPNSGACNLAASIATVLMSESATLKTSLSDCIVSDDGNTVKYKFYGDNNALKAYKGKHADRSNELVIDKILQMSKNVYTVDRSQRLKQAALLPFSAPWIYCLAIALYEYTVDVEAASPGYFLVDMPLQVKADNGQGEESIVYNLLTNTIGKGISAGQNADRPLNNDEIDSIVPEDGECEGKMFKLGSKGHATAIVCTLKGEKRYFDNQKIQENAPYTVIDESIRDYLKRYQPGRQIRQIVVSTIPEAQE